MSTKTMLTVRDYAALDEPPGARYELSNGELIVTPSSSPYHNRIRDNFNSRLRTFMMERGLGEIMSATDLVLLGEVVRRPDVAFIRTDRLQGVELDQSPFPVAPDLAIEIVSKNDWADDLMLKVSQYLDAGAAAVWLMYPNTRAAYRYMRTKREPEVRTADSGDVFEERDLLPGFSVPITEILP